MCYSCGSFASHGLANVMYKQYCDPQLLQQKYNAIKCYKVKNAFYRNIISQSAPGDVQPYSLQERIQVISISSEYFQFSSCYTLVLRLQIEYLLLFFMIAQK